MSAMMRGAGFGGGLQPFGPPSFPAPGTPSTNTPSGLPTTSPSPSPTSNNSSTTGTAGTSIPPNPFALFGGFPAAGASHLTPGATPGSPDVNSNPFALNPALMQQMLGMGALGVPGAGGLGPMGMTSPPPSDTRSPEERFQVQLQQLQDMGFTSAAQNVRALLATGGNVHSAIEYILSGGGL